ncbi:hypothetical protein HAX54_019603, partial [Datura stramonium]|nr:hypothetical protein [Datura stramonium]
SEEKQNPVPRVSWAEGSFCGEISPSHVVIRVETCLERFGESKPSRDFHGSGSTDSHP